MIIPSIDIMGGKIVQLKQGRAKVYESKDFENAIEKYKIFPEINVIDLDAAMGNGSNKELIKSLCKKMKCNVGGGIRNEILAKEYIENGAKCVIIGTLASKDFLKKLPKDKVIVALDTKNGKIAVEGWKRLESQNIFEKMKELEDYCSKYLITNVNVEGLNSGTDLKFFESLVRKN